MTTAIPKNEFQRAAAALERTADALHETAKEPLKAAGESLQRAGEHAFNNDPNNLGAVQHAVGAVGNLGYAAAHGLFAAVDAIDGTLAVGETALRGAAGTAIGAVASATWLGEQGMSGARWAFLNISKFFLAIANGLSKALGDKGHDLVTKSIGDPSAKRLSERLFDRAGDQFQLSAAAAEYAWDAYADAAREVFGYKDSVLSHVAGSLYNAGAFAVHSGAVLGNLGLAAVQAGATPVVLLAELGVRVAKMAVLGAEAGVEGTRDLSVLAAEITAACGNALAHPDQDTYKVSEKTLQEFQAKFEKIQGAA